MSLAGGAGRLTHEAIARRMAHVARDAVAVGVAAVLAERDERAAHVRERAARVDERHGECGSVGPPAAVVSGECGREGEDVVDKGALAASRPPTHVCRHVKVDRHLISH